MRGTDSFQNIDEITYYRVKGVTYLDIHGLMAIVQLSYSSTYRKTKILVAHLDKELVIEYRGKNLYDSDFCFSWWQHWSKLKQEG